MYTSTHVAPDLASPILAGRLSGSWQTSAEAAAQERRACRGIGPEADVSLAGLTTLEVLLKSAPSKVLGAKLVASLDSLEYLKATSAPARHLAESQLFQRLPGAVQALVTVQVAADRALRPTANLAATLCGLAAFDAVQHWDPLEDGSELVTDLMVFVRSAEVWQRLSSCQRQVHASMAAAAKEVDRWTALVGNVGPCHPEAQASLHSSLHESQLVLDAWRMLEDLARQAEAYIGRFADDSQESSEDEVEAAAWGLAVGERAAAAGAGEEGGLRDVWMPMERIITETGQLHKAAKCLAEVAAGASLPEAAQGNLTRVISNLGSQKAPDLVEKLTLVAADRQILHDSAKVLERAGAALRSTPGVGGEGAAAAAAQEGSRPATDDAEDANSTPASDAPGASGVPAKTVRVRGVRALALGATRPVVLGGHQAGLVDHGEETSPVWVMGVGGPCQPAVRLCAVARRAPHPIPRPGEGALREGKDLLPPAPLEAVGALAAVERAVVGAVSFPGEPRHRRLGRFLGAARSWGQRTVRVVERAMPLALLLAAAQSSG